MAGDYILNGNINNALNGSTGTYTADAYPEPTHKEGDTALGTPYYGAIVFKTNDSDATPYTLIDCIYTLTEAADIVRARPTGETDKRRSSVIELTGIADWDISITARLTTNHNERMPTEELQEFRNKLKAGALLDVENKEFNILGIKQLVIESIVFKAEEGWINTLYVDIKAISHTPDELLIDDVEDPTQEEG